MDRVKVAQKLLVIEEALINSPRESYGRESAIRALGALESILKIPSIPTVIYIDEATGIKTLNRPYTP